MHDLMNCATVSLSPGFVYASNSATTVIVSAFASPPSYDIGLRQRLKPVHRSSLTPKLVTVPKPWVVGPTARSEQLHPGLQTTLVHSAADGSGSPLNAIPILSPGARDGN